MSIFQFATIEYALILGIERIAKNEADLGNRDTPRLKKSICKKKCSPFYIDKFMLIIFPVIFTASAIIFWATI